MERYGVPNLPRLGDRPRAKDVTEKSAFVARAGRTNIATIVSIYLERALCITPR